MTALDARPVLGRRAATVATGATGATGVPRHWAVLDGLRAVAVLLVLAFHAEVPGTGAGFIGVDVFFVISGFLISGQLIDELRATGRLDLGGFWARRVRRLLPTAGVVIAATAVGTFLLLPPLAAYRQSADFLASLAYVANWRFIAQGQDYLAPDTAESPVLHLWSLAVEEQLYLVWPLLLLLGLILARRLSAGAAEAGGDEGRALLRAVGTVVGVLALGSFAWSLWLTATAPQVAYLATPARAWQFAAGALLAVGIRHVPGGVLLRRPAVALSLGGAVLLVSAMLLIGPNTPYPGVAALLPTVGTMALIAGGVAGPAAVLTVAPLRHVGALSYGWYLWHWPVLVLARTQWPDLDWVDALALTALAGLLAEATYQLVERPVQRSRTLRSRPGAAASAGLTGSLCALAVVLVLGSLSARQLAAPAVADAATFQVVFGAGDARDSGTVTPAPIDAAADVPPTGCILEREATVRDCTYGVPGGRRVVLFGDSLADQWAPAVEELAGRYDWEVHEFTQAACPAARIAPRDTDAWYSADFCLDWREDALAAIAALAPSLVIVSSLNDYIERGGELQDAWRSTFDTLDGLGAPLVYLRSTPNPDADVPTCVSGSLDAWSACAFPLGDDVDPVVVDVGSGRLGQVRVVDLNGYLCEDGVCPAVRNGILLYRDADHLSATAARVLSPALENALAAADLLR